jgi:serine/threonine protein kinase
MAPTPDTELLQEGPYGAGDVVDARYRLVRALGHGGMGTVWVAHDQVLEVHVALKLMSLRHRGSRQHTLSARLLQEARAAARLGHPGICRVLNFGTTQFGDPYIANELLDGETLADCLLRVGRMSAVDAIRTILPILDALGSAHARGIIHRDVKPDNIFLARGDHGRTQPKLLDFGIARLADTGSKITIEGALLGTPDYMSPEQARGRTETDGRTDVWSACVVVYEMITAGVPFTGENYNAVLWAVMNEDPVPTTQEGAGDGELWDIVERGLAKDPDARWQTMRDLGVEFAKWLYARGVTEDVCSASLRTNWIEASFSGDRPSMISSIPASFGGPPTMAANSGPASIPAFEPSAISAAAPGVRAALPSRPGTDPRISLAGEPHRTSLLGLAGSHLGLIVAAGLALLVGVGGTVWVMSGGSDEPRVAPGAQVAAEQPDPRAKDGPRPKSPADRARPDQPGATASSAERAAATGHPTASAQRQPVAEPRASSSAPDAGQPRVVRPAPTSARSPDDAPPKAAATATSKRKKADDYVLGF